MLFVFVVQVTTIWEGTTNVLSLDVLRVVAPVGASAMSESLEVLFSRVNQMKEEFSDGFGLDSQWELVGDGFNKLITWKNHCLNSQPELLTNSARSFALSIAQLYTGKKKSKIKKFFHKKSNFKFKKSWNFF